MTSVSSDRQDQDALRFYGRRKGRPLRVRKSALIEEALPQVEIALSGKQRLDPRGLFDGRPEQIWLEIGFGAGHHLAAQARTHPAVGLIGCEPFMNGIASLLDLMAQNETRNIRIYPDDARHLLDVLPDASIDRCFVLFADPWPKKRHADRRFIGPENLPRLARIMKKGAELRLATDDPTLRDWMQTHMRACAGFTSAPECPEGVAVVRPADWPGSRYEEKAVAAGRDCTFFRFVRN